MVKLHKQVRRGRTERQNATDAHSEKQFPHRVERSRLPTCAAMSSSSRPPELTQEQFDVYNTDLQATALKATRNAAFLPADLAFYRSLDRGIAKDLDASSARVLGLANRLLDLVSTADNSKSKAKGKGRLEHDDVTDNFRSAVVDSMDQLLERAVRSSLIVCVVLLMV